MSLFFLMWFLNHKSKDGDQPGIRSESLLFTPQLPLCVVFSVSITETCLTQPRLPLLNYFYNAAFFCYIEWFIFKVLWVCSFCFLDPSCVHMCLLWFLILILPDMLFPIFYLPGRCALSPLWHGGMGGLLPLDLCSSTPFPPCPLNTTGILLSSDLRLLQTKKSPAWLPWFSYLPPQPPNMTFAADGCHSL